MSTAITPDSYAEKTARLTSNWQSGSGPLRLKKSTISNLFRYQPRGAAARRLSLGEFNHVLALDAAARTVEVEGLTTYETVVRYCLAARLFAARGARAEAHHGRRRDGRHRHRIDVLPLRLRARRLARGRRPAARRHDRHGARRQRARRPVRRRCRTPTARSATSCARKSRCTAPARTCTCTSRSSTTSLPTSTRCASRPSRPICSSSKGCSSRTAATS